MFLSFTFYSMKLYTAYCFACGWMQLLSWNTNDGSIRFHCVLMSKMTFCCFSFFSFLCDLVNTSITVVFYDMFYAICSVTLNPASQSSAHAYSWLLTFALNHAANFCVHKICCECRRALRDATSYMFQGSPTYFATVSINAERCFFIVSKNLTASAKPMRKGQQTRYRTGKHREMQWSTRTLEQQAPCLVF